jgi:tRNA (cytosine38-C5)-methyltransferase
MGYEITECLLTPTQFGIPNHRMRYYLTARKAANHDETRDSYLETSVIQTTWPFAGQANCEIPPLSQFLEDAETINPKTMVPERFILRLYKFRLDIVRPTDILTSCVTKVKE